VYGLEQERFSESDHALGQIQNSSDAAEVRVAERSVQVGVVRPVQRVEEVRTELGAAIRTG
jgi:hypothetical protein